MQKRALSEVLVHDSDCSDAVDDHHHVNNHDNTGSEHDPEDSENVDDNGDGTAYRTTYNGVLYGNYDANHVHVNHRKSNDCVADHRGNRANDVPSALRGLQLHGGLQHQGAA